MAKSFCTSMSLTSDQASNTATTRLQFVGRHNRDSTLEEIEARGLRRGEERNDFNWISGHGWRKDLRSVLPKRRTDDESAKSVSREGRSHLCRVTAGERRRRAGTGGPCPAEATPRWPLPVTTTSGPKSSKTRHLEAFARACSICEFLCREPKRARHAWDPHHIKATPFRPFPPAFAVSKDALTDASRDGGLACSRTLRKTFRMSLTGCAPACASHT